VRIWVDADACPRVIKDILFRVAERAQVHVAFVANQPVPVPRSPFLQAVQVIDKGATALNPRGELYTRENIRQRLNMRDFLDTMRASGAHTGGPAALDQRDRQAFANALDRFVARAKPAAG
jgi:uncharacterized protein YaiI (UPF0178 family)